MHASDNLTTTLARDQLADVENTTGAQLARLARIRIGLEAIARLSTDTVITGLAHNSMAELDELHDDLEEPAVNARIAATALQ